MEIKGTVIQNIGLQNGTSKAGKEWSKAELVIEYGDQYKKKVKLSNMKNAESFSLIPVGTNGTFHIEPESREFNGKWYSDVSCWKWDLEHDIPTQVKEENATMQASYDDFKAPQKEKAQTTANNSEEDLPF